MVKIPTDEEFYQFLENNPGVTIPYLMRYYQMSYNTVESYMSRCDSAGMLVGMCDADERYGPRQVNTNGYYAFRRVR